MKDCHLSSVSTVDSLAVSSGSFLEDMGPKPLPRSRMWPMVVVVTVTLLQANLKTNVYLKTLLRIVGHMLFRIP